MNTIVLDCVKNVVFLDRFDRKYFNEPDSFWKYCFKQNYQNPWSSKGKMVSIWKWSLYIPTLVIRRRRWLFSVDEIAFEALSSIIWLFVGQLRIFMLFHCREVPPILNHLCPFSNDNAVRPTKTRTFITQNRTSFSRVKYTAFFGTFCCF